MVVFNVNLLFVKPVELPEVLRLLAWALS